MVSRIGRADNVTKYVMKSFQLHAKELNCRPNGRVFSSYLRFADEEPGLLLSIRPSPYRRGITTFLAPGTDHPPTRPPRRQRKDRSPLPAIRAPAYSQRRPFVVVCVVATAYLVLRN